MDSLQTPTTTELPTREHVRPSPSSANEIYSVLLDQFHKFNEADVYEDYMKRAMDEKASNFVVRIGFDDVRIATNLREQDLDALLNLRSVREHDDFPVTWMQVQNLQRCRFANTDIYFSHLWSLEDSYNTLQAMARRYNSQSTFTTLLCPDMTQGWSP